MDGNSVEYHICEYYLLLEWLSKYGKLYKINNLRHLQNCCANKQVLCKDGKIYQYKLPDKWQSQKIKIGKKDFWIIFR